MVGGGWWWWGGGRRLDRGCWWVVVVGGGVGRRLDNGGWAGNVVVMMFFGRSGDGNGAVADRARGLLMVVATHAAVAHVPIACLPMAHWYVFRGDWLWCGNGIRPETTPIMVRGSISRWVCSSVSSFSCRATREREVWQVKRQRKRVKAEELVNWL